MMMMILLEMAADDASCDALAFATHNACCDYLATTFDVSVAMSDAAHTCRCQTLPFTKKSIGNGHG